MSASAEIPLRIRWLDSPADLEVGRELRFEVYQADEPGERRVAVHRLGFNWSPIVWGEARPADDDAFVGICRMVATAPSDDIYDMPQYELSAYVRAVGSASVRPDRRFDVGVGLPEYPLTFFFFDGSGKREFDPAAQKRPIGLDAFNVEPNGAASVLSRDGRFFLRIEHAGARPTVRVRFPNGDEADVTVDVGRGALDEPGAPSVAAAAVERPTKRPAAKAPAVKPAAAPVPAKATEAPASRPRAVPASEAPVSGADIVDEVSTAAGDADRVHEMILELQRYVTSFPMGEMPEKARAAVKGRVGRQVGEVRQAISACSGSRRKELDSLFRSVLASLPDEIRAEV